MDSTQLGQQLGLILPINGVLSTVLHRVRWSKRRDRRS